MTFNDFIVKFTFLIQEDIWIVFTAVLISVFFGVILYPIGILFFKLGLNKIGLRCIAMSLWRGSIHKYCSDVSRCKETKCGNWTCVYYFDSRN